MKVWAAVALALGVGLLLVPLPASWRGIWQSKVLDLGHVPLFAVLTLLLWTLLGPGLLRAVLTTLAVAVLGEICQGWVGRTPGLLDALWGALGALAAAAGIRA